MKRSAFGLLIMVIAAYHCSSGNIKESYAKSNEVREKSSTENIQKKDSVIYCIPEILTKKSSVYINLPFNHPKYFGVYTPSEKFFYVHLPPEILLMPVDSFNHITRFEINSELKGLLYLKGKPTQNKVFTEEGNYKLLFADNLETEPENTFFLTCNLKYKK